MGYPKTAEDIRLKNEERAEKFIEAYQEKSNGVVPGSIRISKGRLSDFERRLQNDIFRY